MPAPQRGTAFGERSRATMPAAPALTLVVVRHGVWRALVLALTAGAGAALLAWAQAQPAAWGAWVVALGGAVAALACGASLLRVPRAGLRWDGQTWWLARGDAAELAGELSVAIDLGAWMLLAFAPRGSRWPSRHWLAVQRRGLEPQWHALRCALYAPRPAAAATAP